MHTNALRERASTGKARLDIVSPAANLHVSVTNAPRLAAQGRSGCVHEQRPSTHGYHRAARVFLARLLIVHGLDAPEVLRRIADELEWLETERAADSVGGTLNPPN